MLVAIVVRAARITLAFFTVFVLLAAIFFFIRLPDVGEGKIEPGFAALKFPHVTLGMLNLDHGLV